MPRGQTLGWTDDDLDRLSDEYDPMSGRLWWEGNAGRNIDRIFESEDDRGRTQEQPDDGDGYVLLIAAIVLPILYSAATAQFIDGNGRILRRSMIVGELDRILKESRFAVQALFDQMVDGTITVSEWQARMHRWVMDVHTTSAALGRGGFTRMDLADLQRLKEILRYHLERLGEFAKLIAEGKVLLDGRARTRSGLYVRSGRGTYFSFEITRFQGAGFTEEMNVLAPIENHCPDCPIETSKGWVPIGTLTPIGDRVCRMNCLCGIEYRSGKNRIRW